MFRSQSCVKENDQWRQEALLLEKSCNHAREEGGNDPSTVAGDFYGAKQSCQRSCRHSQLGPAHDVGNRFEVYCMNCEKNAGERCAQACLREVSQPMNCQPGHQPGGEEVEQQIGQTKSPRGKAKNCLFDREHYDWQRTVQLVSRPPGIVQG